MNADSHLRALLLGPQPHAAGQRRRSGARSVAADSDGGARRSPRAIAADSGLRHREWVIGRSGDRRSDQSPIDRRSPITRSPLAPSPMAAACGRPASRHRRQTRRRHATDPRATACGCSTRPDLLAVGWLANREREKRHGARTFYNYNIRLEATNVCVASCLFCSFARLKPGDAGAYTMSLEQVWDKLRQRADQPLTEVHVVNGLHPDLPFDYYTEHAARLQAHPARHPSEVLHRRRDRVLRRSLRHDRRAGAARADGGGPRFAARRRRRDLRRARAPEDLRTTSAAPIAISRFTARRTGSACASNVTMLYGHIETSEERVDHMLRARALQDETGGFQAFIPLAFHPDNNQMRKLPAPSARRHAARARGGAADARQHPAREGVLDRDRRRGGADVRCGSAPTTSTAPCRKRRSTTWPGRARPRR